MEKMRFETEDLSRKNVEKIGKLFPSCITETKDENGKIKKAIDFEMLKQLLSDEVINEGDEAYEFTWVGKKNAMVEANKPIRKTLRPCKEESKDWDNTENLYIEGDNLEVLKLLQESYLNSIKMIYIDPPYNTGNDFIYNDDFKMNSDEYKDETGAVDEEGNRLIRNTDSNGRFHSDWCSMMYSRLMLARNLLSEDGVIFISIDDNEQDNLRKVCNEVFGENNFVANIIWHKKHTRANDAKWFSDNHDFLVVISKNKSKWKPNLLPRNEESLKGYSNPDNDERGVWASGPCHVKTPNEKDIYPILTPGGKEYYPPDGTSWRFSKDKMNSLIAENRIWFGKDGNNVPRYKRFLTEVQPGFVPTTLWFRDEVGDTQEGNKNMKDIFKGKAPFSNPKPVRLLERCLVLGMDADAIVLDFFSGSATTAHAVMALNAEDGGNRKFIMVQLPEVCDEKSAAYKAGYKNICEIGKERIRRAGEKIKADNADKEGIEKLDTGFRVLKVDDTNMKDVYYTPDEYSQKNLFDMESNIKEDRTELDLLYGCLIDWGIPLNRPYESREIDGCSVHIYSEGDLVACFDEEISEEAIKGIAKMEPLRVVFRDSSFRTSADKINVEEIFKLLSPETSIRVL